MGTHHTQYGCSQKEIGENATTVLLRGSPQSGVEQARWKMQRRCCDSASRRVSASDDIFGNDAPKLPPNSGCPVAGTERSRVTLPIRGNSTAFGKSLKTRDGMVADAVAIERVSASKFPVNREKNRESFNTLASFRLRGRRSIK
jgi:hypothetical protein